jgi:hypothetical protein
MDKDSGIVLHSIDLVDRFGFEDGFLCFSFLHSWLEESGYNSILEDKDPYSHFFYSSQALLLLALDGYLLPHLPRVLYNALELPVYQNNPVAINHDRFYENAKNDDVDENGNILGLDFQVVVSYSQLAELAELAYPVRGKGYLMLFKAVLLDLPSKVVFEKFTSERVILNHPTLLTRKLLDEYTDTFSDQDFEIASHLYHKVEKLEEFHNFFNLAKVL